MNILGISQAEVTPRRRSWILAAAPGSGELAKRSYEDQTDLRLVEMAREFPDVAFLGVDLAPTWTDRVDVPENAQFELCNVVEGISCPDETFDLVHCRALMGGVSSTCRFEEPRLIGKVRDWSSFIKELVRVLRPGGLLLSVDGSTNWPVFDKIDDFSTPLLPEQARARAPGFVGLTDKLFE